MVSIVETLSPPERSLHNTQLRIAQILCPSASAPRSAAFDFLADELMETVIRTDYASLQRITSATPESYAYIQSLLRLIGMRPNSSNEFQFLFEQMKDGLVSPIALLAISTICAVPVQRLSLHASRQATHQYVQRVDTRASRVLNIPTDQISHRKVATIYDALYRPPHKELTQLEQLVVKGGAVRYGTFSPMVISHVRTWLASYGFSATKILPADYVISHQAVIDQLIGAESYGDAYRALQMVNAGNLWHIRESAGCIALGKVLKLAGIVGHNPKFIHRSVDQLHTILEMSIPGIPQVALKTVDRQNKGRTYRYYIIAAGQLSAAVTRLQRGFPSKE